MSLIRLFIVRRQAVAAIAFLAAACLISLPVSETKEKNPIAEEVARQVIAAYGGEGAVYGVQRNGIIKTNLKLLAGETPRDARATTRFIRSRNKKIAEDLVLLELELPDTKYILGFDGQKTWAKHNGEPVEPDEATIRAFRASHLHSYESLLRYKENEAKLEYVGNQKIGPLELDIIDLILPGGERTRYFISRKSLRILYLEYETRPKPDAAPVKYRFEFSDFRQIQFTLVPFRILVFENSKKIEERNLIEVAYNVQLEESAFKVDGVSKPAETAQKPGTPEE
jgi:hypothetical protein